MKLEDAARPVPGPGQVTIRVHAAGVNPVDTYIRAGAYARKPNLPYTPGTDVGGIVRRDRRQRDASEDRRSCLRARGAIGGYARDRAVRRLAGVSAADNESSFQQGSAIGVPYATAWRGAVHARAGAAGRIGARARRERRRRHSGSSDRARARHARHRHGRHARKAWRSSAARARTTCSIIARPTTCSASCRSPAGAGVDVVLEMLANVNLDRDLDVLAPHGRVVVIGNRGRVEIDPRKAMARDAAILGMTLFNATREHLEEIHAGIVAGLENGALNPVIGKEFPLADAAKAHVAVMDSGALGKIVLVP